MPLNPVDIAAARANGVCIICASCDRYWEGLGRGLGRCATEVLCGSPFIGDTFCQYRGPVTDSVFRLRCFVCGAASKHVVQVRGQERRIGICAVHKKLFWEVQSKDVKTNLCNVLIDGIPVTEPIPTYGKKTLAQAIAEVEDYYAKKEG